MKCNSSQESKGARKHSRTYTYLAKEHAGAGAVGKLWADAGSQNAHNVPTELLPQRLCVCAIPSHICGLCDLQ